jgi:hypothetical protein
MFFPYRSILIPIQFDDPSPLALGWVLSASRSTSAKAIAGSVTIFAVPRDPRSTDRSATVSLSGTSMPLMKSYGPSTANERLIRPSDVRVSGVTIVGVK